MTEALQQREPIEIDGGINGIVLRELSAEDAERYFQLVNFNPDHFTSVGEPTATKYQTLEAVQKSFEVDTSKTETDETRVRFGILARGVMVGSINYHVSGVVTPRVEVGYWVGQQYKGHGYAADAVRTLAPYLFAQGWPEIEAHARESNVASRKTLINSGFIETTERLADFIKFVMPSPSN